MAAAAPQATGPRVLVPVGGGGVAAPVVPVTTAAALPPQQQAKQATGTISLAPPTDLASSSAQQVSADDVQKVQSLIERCLLQSLTQEEAVTALESEAQIQPTLTRLVWQKLEEQNPEFYQAYYMRLKLKDQIVLFNHLLEQQMRMFQSIQAGPWIQAAAATATAANAGAPAAGPQPQHLVPANANRPATPFQATMAALPPGTTFATANPSQQQHGQQQRASGPTPVQFPATSTPTLPGMATAPIAMAMATTPQPPPAPVQPVTQPPPCAPQQFVPGVTTVTASAGPTTASATLGNVASTASGTPVPAAPAVEPPTNNETSGGGDFDLGGNMELPGWVVGSSVSGADGDCDLLSGFGMSDLELQGTYGDATLSLMNHDDEKQYLNDAWAV